MSNHNIPTADIRLDSGFETSLIELLYMIEEGDECENFVIEEQIGESNEKMAIAKIDELARTLGTNPLRWVQDVKRLRVIRDTAIVRESMDSHEARSIRLHGESIGNYVVRRSYDALPIEWEDSGDGSIEVTVSIDPDYYLTLRSIGEFSTDYGDDDDSQSEMSIKINYVADIKKDLPTPTNSDEQ